MLDEISKNLREHTVNALLASGVKPAFESTPGCPDDVRSVCAWAVQGCRCQPRSTIKKIAKRVPNMCHERTVMFASLPEGTTGTTTSTSTAQRQERPGQSFRQKQLKRRVFRKICFRGCGRCGAANAFPFCLRQETQDEEELNIAPKKANWDLKRDVEKKLDKLNRRTQRAIVEIIRERMVEVQHAVRPGSWLVVAACVFGAVFGCS